MPTIIAGPQHDINLGRNQPPKIQFPPRFSPSSLARRETSESPPIRSLGTATGIMHTPAPARSSRGNNEAREAPVDAWGTAGGTVAHSVSLFAVLFALWLLWSGHTEPFLVLSGVVSSAAVVWFARRLDVLDHESYPLHLSWRLPGYMAWLVWEVVKAAWDVTKRALHPAMPIDPVLEWVPVSQKTDLGRVIYANSITLTPGTVSTVVEAERILVHAIHRDGIDSLLEGTMDRRVSETENAT